MSIPHFFVLHMILDTVKPSLTNFLEFSSVSHFLKHEIMKKRQVLTELYPDFISAFFQ